MKNDIDNKKSQYDIKGIKSVFFNVFGYREYLNYFQCITII